MDEDPTLLDDLEAILIRRPDLLETLLADLSATFRPSLEYDPRIGLKPRAGSVETISSD